MSWRYAKSEYRSFEAAIRVYFPQHLRDPQIAFALTQIAVAEAAIDKIMTDLTQDEDDD